MTKRTLTGLGIVLLAVVLISLMAWYTDLLDSVPVLKQSHRTFF
jgi:hypothetical protein